MASDTRRAKREAERAAAVQAAREEERAAESQRMGERAAKELVSHDCPACGSHRRVLVEDDRLERFRQLGRLPPGVHLVDGRDEDGPYVDARREADREMVHVIHCWACDAVELVAFSSVLEEML